MGKYFGTDGFRGEANVQLTVDNAFKVGRYVGWYYGRDHKAKIVIGKDTRRSSYMFEYALVAGLTASGADAYLLHVTTTPSVSFAVRTEDLGAGDDRRLWCRRCARMRGLQAVLRHGDRSDPSWWRDRPRGPAA